MTLKRCPQCSGRFLPKSSPRQIFCGWTCQRRHAAENKPRATDEQRAASRRAINARHWQKRKAHLSSVSRIATDSGG